MNLGVLDERVDYDGRQLRSLFVYERTGRAGDGALAFVGACDVAFEAMVDAEDWRARNAIVSPEMLHFVVEHFGLPLEPMVWRQRLFARLAADLLREHGAAPVRVAGDDVFVGERKASVSVATASPVSALFHFGLNVRTEGVPVPAFGLGELGVEPRAFARDLLARYDAETDDVRAAAAKVRWVH